MELFDEVPKSNKEPKIDYDFLYEGIGYCKKQGMYISISDFFIFCVENDCPNKKLILGLFVSLVVISSVCY